MAERSNETPPREMNNRPQVEEPVLPKVTLSIKSQDGDRIYYRLPRDRKIQFLLSAYCKGKNLNFATVVFLYNGERIKTSKTANELGMEDGDQIDAMVHQNGGGRASN
ncbi:hypothetical protein ABFS82_11G087200 [Erythranthe guttata]|uniref:small ubiquitin-related modifier 2-like n=1 Tax=Erythranthe guttata TaxID=4155 RepID=UPI00064D7644|nr:PREDICTED: small ubiquitin-related modifier 2-like [Erythranthe guttata]|eukprot:XP_012853901.1 PREDICTED: small ubiquitin-related modifier 2-like [Erythranthe guttata]